MAAPVRARRAGDAQPLGSARGRRPRSGSPGPGRLTGPVRSHWSMSACRQAAKVVPRPRSQASRLAAARMLLRACAVGVRGRAACRGAGAQAAHHLPGGVGLHQPPVRGWLDASRSRCEPLPGAGEFLVAGRQRAAGGEHVPQVVGGPPARAGVKRLVGQRQPPGRDVGEQRRRRRLAAASSARREAGGWRVIASSTRPAPAGRCRRGRPAARGPGGAGSTGAAAFLVELVFGAAVGAGVSDRDPGALGAGVSVRAGRGD